MQSEFSALEGTPYIHAQLNELQARTNKNFILTNKITFLIV